MTINEALSLMKAVRGRKSELISLRNNVSTRDIYSYTEKDKITEPQYDVKSVDRKIAELDKFLFKTDAAIKQVNATTNIDITADVDSLLEPLA